ncbi:hypothetical protein [Celeribacter naphthalenivorans]|uniref:hypothetical protein n=1 Tax=Celeribacter naphthalenivorans TaxID=1614694 RepID=UPI001CFB07B5|nr:hypothetical protein [Celeribacter naphthalenivorans]
MTAQNLGANYVLTALLPRLEKLMPGLCDELLAGIRADKEAINMSGKLTADVEEIFCSAEKILAHSGHET